MFGSRSDKLVYFWIILLIMVAGTFMSVLIPPFQSPDEYDHVKRAYFLAHGHIILDAPKGRQSGGTVDAGLEAYMSAYSMLPSNRGKRLWMDRVEAAKSIQWGGDKIYTESPGSAVYFPLIYAPQAIGLVLGEKLGLTVDHSYRLARFSALLVIALTLIFAFRIYHTNPLIIGMLVLPMALFQFSSATLDGVSNALALLVISIFLKIATEKKASEPWLFNTLVISVVVLVGARLHVLPLLLLVFYAAYLTGNKKNLLWSALATVFVLVWVAIAIKTTVNGRVALGSSTGAIALFYVKHPLAFYDVLQYTLTETTLAQFYRESFMGILGWLDTPFHPDIYGVLGGAMIVIAVASISWKKWREDLVQRLLLLVCAMLSILLVFFALLVSWTPHPATVIAGVQGRYFYIPAFMIAYAIAGRVALDSGIVRKAALATVVGLGLYAITVTGLNLIDRYYLALEQVAEVPVSIQTSAVLAVNSPIKLHLMEDQTKQPKYLKRLGILFGTFVRTNPGMADLELVATDGRVETIGFDLSKLSDNAYKFIRLDPLPYTSGDIYFQTGGGVIAWQAHYPDGSVATCLVYEFTDGEKRYTKGCPRF